MLLEVTTRAVTAFFFFLTIHTLSLSATLSTNLLTVWMLGYNATGWSTCFCTRSTYAGLPSATNVVALRLGSGRRGGDHRSDYFSCCCVIARLWHVIRGNGPYLSPSQRGDEISLKAWLQAVVHLKVNVLFLSINYLIRALLPKVVFRSKGHHC